MEALGMALTRIAVVGNCDDTNCPSVHTTDDPDVLVVQGNRLDAATRAELGGTLPDHEDAVTIPADVILRAARVIEGQA
jgi:hypothetical protein